MQRPSTPSEDSDWPPNPLLEDHVLRRQAKCAKCSRQISLSSFTRFSWFVSFVLFIALLQSLLSAGRRGTTAGFWGQSEFAPATRDISPSWIQVHFKANLKYNESNKIYRPIPQGTDYVGAAGSELDAAWKALIGAVEVTLTEDEAKIFGDKIDANPVTGKYTGL
ncbi:hypothetical protein LEL_09722 [Akanthomyces lecanii RCEF 1005]|uniref:Uncharacterized protein n=1 Tax=Akanthomyces lecanii RCEF 1005 TaxID=1081108 RepID=A0A168C9Y3_CORDF|nr:hypothetical protein LEL_09722 [Akanthomyces lecanii RCEF 1005]